MDEFVHRPKPFRSIAPKVEQFRPPPATPKILPPEPPRVEPVSLPAPVIKETPPPKPPLPSPVLDKLPEKFDLKLDDSPKASNHWSPKKRRFTKKKLLIILAAIIALGIAGGAVYWFVLKEQPTTVAVNNQITPTVAPTPTPSPVSPLTGVQLASAALAARPVTGMMIENSEAARPQSGLLEAGMVFEAIAEGGITRFLALYQEAQPQYIGPVRSIRPYYIDFAMAFDAAVGHVGGSPDALSDIQSLGMKDLDQFANGNSYWRTDREAPHNVYTSFEKIDSLNSTKSFTTSTFTPFGRKNEVPQTPAALFIDFSISGFTYSPRFEYDATTNTYKRFQAGEAHTDQKSGTQIAPKVVVAMVMGRSLMSDGSHNSYQTTGSGKIFVFQDGIVSEGTWVKEKRTSSFILTDKNGLPMLLNAGQTWVSVVESESAITYKL